MKENRILAVIALCLMTTLAVNAENLFSSLLGKSQEEVNQRLEQLWQHFFTPGDVSVFDADGQKTVYYETADNMAFIYDTGSNDVRSEGMSYGMMISVQTDHRVVFDKLWRWAKRYMAYPKDSAWDGYFCWQCTRDGKQIGNSNASDGELYFATIPRCREMERTAICRGS